MGMLGFNNTYGLVVTKDVAAPFLKGKGLIK